MAKIISTPNRNKIDDSLHFDMKSKYSDNSLLFLQKTDDLKSQYSSRSKGHSFLTQSGQRTNEICQSCFEAKVLYPDFVDLCNKCLKSVIIEELRPKYKEYLKQANILYKSQKSSEIKHTFEKRFHGEHSKQITIRGKKIEIGQIEKILGQNIQFAINQIKTDFCNICQKNAQVAVENQDTKNVCYLLACDCFICSKNCFKTYMENLLENPSSKELICVCRYVYKMKDLESLYLEHKDNYSLIKINVGKYLIEKFTSYCMGCFNYIDLTSKKSLNTMLFKLTIENDEVEKIFPKGNICYHLSCLDCYIAQKYTKETTLDCFMCQDKHFVSNVYPINVSDLIKPESEEKKVEEDCLIF